MPGTIFTSGSVIGALGAFFLPETAWCPLPETVEDIQNRQLTVTQAEREEYHKRLKEIRKNTLTNKNNGSDNKVGIVNNAFSVNGEMEAGSTNHIQTAL